MSESFLEEDLRRRVAAFIGLVGGGAYAFGVPVAAAVIESSSSGYLWFVFTLVEVALNLLLLIPLREAYTSYRQKYSLSGRLSLLGLMVSLGSMGVGFIINLFPAEITSALPVSVFTTTAIYAVHFTASTTGISLSRGSIFSTRTAVLFSLSAPIYFAGYTLGMLDVLPTSVIAGSIMRLPLYLAFMSLGLDLWTGEVARD